MDVTITKAPITTVTASVDAPVKGQPLDFTAPLPAAHRTASRRWSGSKALPTPARLSPTLPPPRLSSSTTQNHLKANPGETFDEKFKTGAANGDYSVTRVSNTELLLTKAYPQTGSVKVTKVEIGGAAPT